MQKVMRENKKVYLIFAGLGYPRYEEFKEEFGDRAINADASEQTALDIAVGLAYAKKIPVVYTITPFLLRGFETIRTYINHERLHVLMVGAGVDDDYSKHDGFSHEAGDINEFFCSFGWIIRYRPNTVEVMKDNIDMFIRSGIAGFINIKK